MQILLAEDLEDTRELMRALLELKGHSVIEAADGQQAVDAAKKFKPDIVLMDLNMPFLDGIAAIRIIRDDPIIGSTPIVALSARAGSTWREEAMAAGCDALLSKPLSFEDLDAVLQRIARQPPPRREG